MPKQPLYIKEHFSKLLMEWYEENKRDLPWRRTFLPYHIWISEMMLQQTQMVRGVEYFERWIHRFPSIMAVAEASIEELYKYWEGLGYYSRVRNIHVTAKRIMEEYNGIIPSDVILLESLQGIGPYTARAIASIAYNKDVPVVDANVIRIITRIFGIKEPITSQQTQDTIYSLANEMLPRGNARTFNQAMMELGAMICSRQTKCSLCPLARLCYAYTHNCTHELPLQSPKKQIYRYNTMAVILVHKNTIFMRKRPRNGVWANLWEFPEYKFTPTHNTIAEQHTMLVHEDNTDRHSDDITPHTARPQPADLAHAFYSEYSKNIEVSHCYMTTKYSFTTNRVTLYAFYASLLDHDIDLCSAYFPQQQTCFCSKTELSQHTLSSGQNVIRNAFLQSHYATLL